jgi:hypothetical protein
MFAKSFVVVVLEAVVVVVAVVAGEKRMAWKRDWSHRRSRYRYLWQSGTFQAIRWSWDHFRWCTVPQLWTAFDVAETVAAAAAAAAVAVAVVVVVAVAAVVAVVVPAMNGRLFGMRPHHIQTTRICTSKKAFVSMTYIVT